MSEPRKKSVNNIRFDNKKVKADITIHESEAFDEVRYGRLVSSAAYLPETDEDESIVKVMAAYIYPQCVVCADGTVTVGEKEYSAKDIPLGVFVHLPGSLVSEWREVSEIVNPHLVLPLPTVDEKKT